MKHATSLFTIIVFAGHALAACSSNDASPLDDLGPADAGDGSGITAGGPGGGQAGAGAAAMQPNGRSAAGSGSGGTGFVAGGAGSIAGRGGSAGGIAGAGTMGSAGPSGAAGSESSGPGAVASSAAGGGAGSAGAGGQAGTALPAIDCPLGSLDADQSGYPDACEKVLAELTFDTKKNGITDQSTVEIAAYFVLLHQVDNGYTTSAGGDCGDGHAIGQEYTVTPGHAESRIFDPRSYVHLQHWISCIQKYAGEHPQDRNAGLSTPSKLLFNVRTGDWNTDRINDGSGFYKGGTVTPCALAGKTVVYVQREVLSYAPAPHATDSAFVDPNFVGRWRVYGY